jgi:DNA ligase 1
MLLADVVETSRRIASTTKRLEKTALLSALLRRLTPDEVAIVVPFLSGAVRQGRIGIGYSRLRDALSPPASIPALQIAQVDRALDDFSAVKGPGSEQRRNEILRTLLAQATEPEQQFLAGLLGGEIRQGALEGIMIEAIAKAANIPAERIRRAAMLSGSITATARAALEQGEPGLAAFDIQLFRPIQPMLAGSAEYPAEAVAELGNPALEWKLDGARIQAHKSGDQVAIYSRAMNDVSLAIPEVVDAIRALPANDLILDGEVLSLDANGRPQPFQVSMRRFGRKLDVASLMDELPMTPFWFDLLYLNGQPAIDQPQRDRFSELSRLVPANNLIPNTVAASPTDAQEFLDSAIAHGHEGIMAKARDAVYAAGARGQSWLKIKRARTLDLVILAAEWGNGRRQGWLSNLHLGARDTDKGGFAMLGKTFKGLTDEMLRWQTEEFLKIEIARDRHTVYLEPRIVAEIAFNEIQVSPRYPSGLALRFARVKRYRSDKPVSETDTYQTVKQLAGI